MKIAILAVQGAFAEHEQMLNRLGAETLLVRNLQDWQQPKDALVMPGGESTAMTRIMHDEGLWQPVRQAILQGLPVMGTCAGLIMLDRNHLGTMDILAQRNAYGRQLGSFVCEGDFPMVFIRAPYIKEWGDEVEPLTYVDDRLVAARQGKQLVFAFHPELTKDSRMHEMFLSMI